MPDAIEQPPAARALYEADEHAWIAAQISALTLGSLTVSIAPISSST